MELISSPAGAGALRLPHALPARPAGNLSAPPGPRQLSSAFTLAPLRARAGLRATAGRRYGVRRRHVQRVEASKGNQEERDLQERVGSRLEDFLRSTPNDGKLMDNPTTEGDPLVAFLSASAVGGFTGLAIVAFEELTSGIRKVGLTQWLPLLGFEKAEQLEVFGQVSELPALGAAWPIATLPLFGGLAITALRFGLGGRTLTPALKDLNRDPGKESASIKPWKFTTRAAGAAVTLGTGNSLGPEGPVVELGGNIGILIGSKLGFRGEDLRGYLASGCAAGLAAGFNAPISAIFFALEVVLKKTQDRQLLTSTLLSAVVAATVKDQILGLTPKFVVTESTNGGLVEVPAFLVVGVVCGLFAVLLEKSIEKSQGAFKAAAKVGFPAQANPLLGSLTMTTVALFVPETLFFGYRGVDSMLNSPASFQSFDQAGTLLLIGTTKVFVTAVAVGSGLIGGVFAPSLFIGASVGASLGTVAQALGLGAGGLEYTSSPAVYALIGMPSMLAAFVKAPLTSILLLFEITREYNIVLPVMAGVSAATFTDIQVRRLLDAEAEARAGDVRGVRMPTWACEELKLLQATQAMDTNFITLPISIELLKAARAMADAQLAKSALSCRGVALVDADGCVVGAASVATINIAVNELSDRCRKIFEQFDVSGSGSVSADEVVLMLRRAGADVSEEEIRAEFSKMDVDADGGLGFKEFVRNASAFGLQITKRTLQDQFCAVAGTPRATVQSTDTLYQATVSLFESPSRTIAVVGADGAVEGIILEDGLESAARFVKLEEELERMI